MDYAEHENVMAQNAANMTKITNCSFEQCYNTLLCNEGDIVAAMDDLENQILLGIYY